MTTRAQTEQEAAADLRDRISAQAGDAAEFLDKYGLESDPDATLRAIASAITHDIDNGAYPTFGIACLVEAQHRRNTTPGHTNQPHAIPSHQIRGASTQGRNTARLTPASLRSLGCRAAAPRPLATTRS